MTRGDLRHMRQLAWRDRSESYCRVREQADLAARQAREAAKKHPKSGHIGPSGSESGQLEDVRIPVFVRCLATAPRWSPRPAQTRTNCKTTLRVGGDREVQPPLPGPLLHKSVEEREISNLHKTEMRTLRTNQKFCSRQRGRSGIQGTSDLSEIQLWQLLRSSKFAMDAWPRPPRSVPWD